MNKLDKSYFCREVVFKRALCGRYATEGLLWVVCCEGVNAERFLRKISCRCFCGGLAVEGFLGKGRYGGLTSEGLLRGNCCGEFLRRVSGREVFTTGSKEGLR